MGIDKKNKSMFIVGMPRSGTKLLRNLLNQHPKISIDPMETVFLPIWHKRWQTYGDISKYPLFERFYRKNLSLRYMRNYFKSGKLVTASDWYHACESFDTAGVFEGLIRSQVGIGTNADIIWGDKTPSYLVHIPLIKKIFPDSKIVHIIRDVRDCSLSINLAWKKDMLRAAQRWVDDVGIAIFYGRTIKGYYEIKYENLLENPERELRLICNFLGIDFDRTMLTLSRPSEKSGNAKGKAFIVRENSQKYMTRMRPDVRKKIEEISWELLRDLGYPTLYQGPTKRIGRVQMLFLKVIDGINLIRRGKIQNISDVRIAMSTR